MAETTDQPRRGSAKDYYERITALMQTTQVSATDAAKTVAQELGKTENTVLSAYYRHARKIGGPNASTSGRGRARRRSAKTVDAYLADVRTAFERALKRVNADVEDAQAELDQVKDKHSKDLAALKARHAKELETAKTKLDDAKATVKTEKAKLEDKIKLLSS